MILRFVKVCSFRFGSGSCSTWTILLGKSTREFGIFIMLAEVLLHGMGFDVVFVTTLISLGVWETPSQGLRLYTTKIRIPRRCWRDLNKSLFHLISSDITLLLLCNSISVLNLHAFFISELVWRVLSFAINFKTTKSDILLHFKSRRFHKNS